MPRLQYLLEENQRIRSIDNIDDPRYERNLRIMRNEFIELHRSGTLPPFEYLGLLNKDDFTESVADETQGYLFFIRLTYNNIASEARRVRDSIYTALTDSLGTDAVFRLRQQNYNKALSDWVLNNNEVNKYLETDNRIIQKYEPVFMIPEHNWGRAH